MATLMQESAIDGYGNKFQLWAEETGTSQSNNTSTVHVWLDLWVAGNVSSANVRVNVTGGQESSLGYQSWGAGGYRLKEATFTANHNPDGSGSAHVEGYFTGGLGTWNLSGNLQLTKISRQSTINSFTGTDINSNFNATYTAYTNYENRLRISIPNVVALQTFNNYASGTNVKLSNSAKQQIKQYTSEKTVTLGGVIETWNGGTKIGDSSEINISVKIPKGVHIKVDGTWKEAVPYVRVNKEWKESIPHIKVNETWKEGI